MNEKHVIGKLRELQATFEKELDNVMRFWFKNSHDPSNGYVYLKVMRMLRPGTLSE